MLRSIQQLEQFTIGAGDSTIGYIKDFLFDQQAWVVRYLVVDVGVWLTNRKVLISPFSIGAPDWDGKVFPVSISKQQIKTSPPIDTHQPISRQDELRHTGYYGYPSYWGGGDLWGEDYYPSLMLGRADHAGRRRDGVSESNCAAETNNDGDIYLHGCKAVQQFRIQGGEGDFGRIQGFLVDDECWAIRYLIVNYHGWAGGQPTLLAPAWIDTFNRADGLISTDLTRQALQDAPRYDATAPLLRDQEIGIYAHHGRRPYWSNPGQSAVA